MNPASNEQGRADEGIECEKRELSEQTLHRLHSKLARVETIESLGVVTATIAFELRQSLCGIVTNANACFRMLAADPPKFESARETVQRAIRDSNRALEAVTRFETLFARETANTESVVKTEATRVGGCPVVK
jgi:C4-dicarboxylate-specific signal transduction histidine kinase